MFTALAPGDKLVGLFSADNGQITVANFFTAIATDVSLNPSNIFTCPGTTTSPVFQTQTNGVLFGGFLGTISGNYGINDDGSCQFARNNFTVDGAGNSASATHNVGLNYLVGGVQVLGSPSAPIANATNSVDVVTQLNLLLAAARSQGWLQT